MFRQFHASRVFAFLRKISVGYASLPARSSGWKNHRRPARCRGRMRAIASNKHLTQAGRLLERMIPINTSYPTTARWKRRVPRDFSIYTWSRQSTRDPMLSFPLNGEKSPGLPSVEDYNRERIAEGRRSHATGIEGDRITWSRRSATVDCDCRQCTLYALDTDIVDTSG
jgi:hypothetical protein